MCVEPELNLKAFIVGNTKETMEITFCTTEGNFTVVMKNAKANNLACTILNAIERWKE